MATVPDISLSRTIFFLSLLLGSNLALGSTPEEVEDESGLTLSFQKKERASATSIEWDERLLKGADAPDPKVATSTESLALEDLIRLATRDSFQIRVSSAQIQEAKALYNIAVSLAYPQGQAQLLFGGPTSEARTTVQDDINTLTEASRGGDLNLGELGVSLQGGASVGIPLLTFGKISRAKQATQHLVQATRHQLEATRASVVLDLIRVYWGWQLLRSLVTSLEEGESRLENVLNQIEELLDSDSGQVTENDRLRLKFALSTLSVRKAQAEGGLAQLGQVVRLLVGMGQDEPLELRVDRIEDAVPKRLPPVDDLINAARIKRFQLKALHEVVEAQEDFRELQRARMLPTIFFGAFANFAFTTNATDQRNPFINDPFNFFDAGVGLGLTLDLDFFTKLAEVEQAEAQLNVRTQQQVLAIEASELEVRSLHARITAEIEQSRRIERAQLSARGWLTATTLAYDVGAGQADELIDAFLAWATSIAELQSTRYDRLIHFAELARATGRLIQPRP